MVVCDDCNRHLFFATCVYNSIHRLSRRSRNSGLLRGSEKTAVGNRGPAAFEEAKASAAFPELLRKAKGLRGEFRGCRRRRR